MKLLNLGNRIKRIRLSNQFSQVDVCQGIISTSHYSNIENGRYHPNVETLSLLALKLSVPESYFKNSYEESKQIQELLKIYEQKIEADDTEETNFFYQSNKELLEFIPSFKQEFQFHLLRFLHLVKLRDLAGVIALYTEKIEVIQTPEDSLNAETLQRYFYVSGLYFYFIKKYDASIDYLKKTIEISMDPSFRAKITYNLSLALYSQYKYDEALLYAKEAKSIHLEMHNWIRTGECYNLIAVLLRKKNRPTESEEYIEKGFSITNDEAGELRATLYHNLALIRMDQGNYKAALDNINTCININKKNQKTYLFAPYRIKCKILLLTEDILQLIKTVAIVYNYVRSKTDEAHYQFIMAQMDYLLEDYRSYENSINKCIDIFHTESSWKNLKDAAKHYSLFLEERKRYKSALAQQKLCTLALEKMNNWG
ncbi:tetratricopeptide repeat protein [Sporosarcina sp. FA9]|uniref:tetratricopeptide repeat protein n=1 Tax=Sporosarcina sp. FA9 TaxID=3413030 RepID=UPI003F65A4AC